MIDEPTADYLASYRFSGDVDGYAEGEVYFPYSPLLTVSGTFAEAVLLETVVLSILNYDCGCCRGRSTNGHGRSGSIDHRDGVATRARTRRGRSRTRRVSRGVRVDVEPRREPAVRRADSRHRRARVHLVA